MTRNNDWIGWVIGLGGVALGLYALIQSATASTNDTGTSMTATPHSSSVANTTGPSAAASLESLLQGFQGFITGGSDSVYAGQGQIGISDTANDPNLANDELTTLANLLKNTSGVTGAWWQVNPPAAAATPSPSAAISASSSQLAAFTTSANNVGIPVTITGDISQNDISQLTGLIGTPVIVQPPAGNSDAYSSFESTASASQMSNATNSAYGPTI